MKKLFIIALVVLFCGVSVGFACTLPNCTHINNGGAGGAGGQGGSVTNTFTPTNNNTFSPSNSFSPTVVGGATTFSGITGGNLSSPSASPAAASVATSGVSPLAASPGSAGVQGVGVAGIGQANNSGSGQMNNGIGVQNNGSGVLNNGDGAGATNISQKYEEARQMAGVVFGQILTDLQFKYGRHTGESDSRVSENPNEVIEQLNTLELQEAIRGKGAKGDVKIIDSLIRPQFYKTTSIETFSRGTTPVGYPTMRYLGSITAVAAKNDVNFENVVCAAAEFGMENGATHMILTKTSFTEWGDTTGYSFELMPFITSILGGAGKNAMGVGAGGGAGMNTMAGGSADRPDAAFKFFVDQKTLEANSARSQKK